VKLIQQGRKHTKRTRRYGYTHTHTHIYTGMSRLFSLPLPTRSGNLLSSR
jgi:hypothetical protein